MITFLKKRKHRRTSRLKMSFNKPTIRIIDNNNNIVNETANEAEIEAAIEAAIDTVAESATVAETDVKTDAETEVDDNDMISINMSKISSITNNFKGKKGDLKKSILTNASLVKELLIKTIDKHKIDMCTQLASQLVEVYNKKHENTSSNCDTSK